VNSNKTIIYYTSNRESVDFEKKITDGILAVKGDIPLISVSQKPMNFGENICIGSVGYSYLNGFRQLLIGCEKATTEYVVMCESDCLYPKTGYFDFEPTDPNMIYSYNNVWILKQSWDNFCRKEQTHGSMIYGREFLIKLIKESLVGLPMWDKKNRGFPFYRPEHKFEYFHKQPIINVITGANGRKGTSLMREKSVSLEYWGSVKTVKESLWTR
jgi:hypothetical protein